MKTCATVNVARIRIHPGFVSLSAAINTLRGRSDASSNATNFTASTAAEKIPPGVSKSGRLRMACADDM